MIKRLNIIVLLLQLLIVLSYSPAFSLERLSGTDMKNMVAQSGVSVAVSEAIIFNAHDAVRIINEQGLDSYLEFNDVASFTTVSCGINDIDGDDYIGNLSVDVFTLNDRAYFSMKAEDLEFNKDMTIGEINYCGTDVGSLKMDNFTLSSFHLYAGAHDSGIDAEIGFAARTELIEFQYNDAPISPDTGKLAIKGITFANSFTGTDSDPSTWAPVGEFTIGDIENDKPVVLDISAGTIDNPNIHISLQADAIEGSMRVENINFGGNDVGQVILDGIDFQQFDIEFPGRGLGNP